MIKKIYIDGNETNFWIEDTGRLWNERTKRWLKGGVNKGYHFYSLYFRSKQYVYYTHRLVAEYFISNPDNLPIVHHIDGNKLNNMFTNLQWVSNKEHQETIQIQKQSKEKTERTHQQLKDFENYGKIAQFRDSPYYATETGKILNLSKKIELRLEKSGNYLRFHAAYNLKGQHFLVHRAVWEAFNGPIPEGYDIDHIDGDPHNNYLNNLRAVTHVENLKNRNIDFSYVSANFYHGE